MLDYTDNENLFLVHAHTHTYRKVELVEIVFIYLFVLEQNMTVSYLTQNYLCYNIVLLKLTVEKKLFFLFFKNIQSIVDQFYILLIVSELLEKWYFKKDQKTPPNFKNYLLQ